jgi:hypothetical protein
MVRFLELKYLVFLVVASLVAIVLLQVTGDGDALQADAPLVRYEAELRAKGRQRDRDVEPMAGRAPGRGVETRWR